MKRSLERIRALTLDISPLRTSVPYRALWSGQVVSLIGTHMRVVGVAFQVFAITKSTAAVGLVSLAEVLPLIAFSMIGGALADAMDKRRIMVVSQVLLLADSACLAALTLAGSTSLLWIYALVAIGGAVDAVDRPARLAMVPSLVRSDQIPAAVALRQVVFQTTLIAGPALGGLLIAGLGNVGWLYVVDAATFLVALVTLRWVPATKEHLSAEQSTEPRVTVDAIREGLAYVSREPLILSIFLIDLVAMIFGMPRAVFPALAERTFSTGATGLGLLYAAVATGGLFGALTTGWVKRVRRRGVAVLVAVAAWGAAITLAGISLFSFPLTLFWLAMAGAADVISAVFRGSMLLEATPKGLLGRVNALNLVIVSGGPRVGDVEAGLVAQVVGAGPSVIVGGVASLAGTLFVAARFRPLRNYRSPASPKARPAPPSMS